MNPYKNLSPSSLFVSSLLRHATPFEATPLCGVPHSGCLQNVLDVAVQSLKYAALIGSQRPRSQIVCIGSLMQGVTLTPDPTSLLQGYHGTSGSCIVMQVGNTSTRHNLCRYHDGNGRFIAIFLTVSAEIFA